MSTRLCPVDPFPLSVSCRQGPGLGHVRRVVGYLSPKPNLFPGTSPSPDSSWSPKVSRPELRLSNFE